MCAIYIITIMTCLASVELLAGLPRLCGVSYQFVSGV